MSLTAEVNPIEKWASQTCTGEMQAQDSNPPMMFVRATNDLVFSKPDNLWENGKTITYAFIGAPPLCGTPKQRAKVAAVLSPNAKSTWVDYANVKFKRLPDDRAASAIVRIQFVLGRASWACIGQAGMKVGRSQPTMKLGRIADDEVLADSERGIILHEFGHVLGLVHEHQSPKTGGVITLRDDAVKAVYTKEGWSADQVMQQILRKYNESEVTNFTEFDRFSIMIYYMGREMSLEGIEIPPNDALSPLDKAFAAVHYPYFGEAAKKHKDADILQALAVLGIVPPGFGQESDILLPVTQMAELKSVTTTDDAGDKADDRNGLCVQQDVGLMSAKEIMALYDERDWVGIRQKVKEVFAAIRTQKLARSVL